MTIALAAMTAEKLNIQPIDRSMSRMTTHEHHAQGEHAREGAVRQELEQGLGLEECRVGDADEADQYQEGDDDARLLRQARTQRARRPHGSAGGSAGAMAVESSVVKRLPRTDLVTRR